MFYPQRLRAHGFLIGFILVAPLLIQTASSCAESSSATELDRIRTANQVIERVAVTRLELERCYLDQIISLRKNKHASWLELARQQCVVDSLASQLESLQRLGRFVDQLEARIDFTSGGLSNDDLVLSSRTPIKVFWPGSIRMIGWLEPVAGEHAELEFPMIVATGSPENRLIKLAEGRFKRAEKLCQDIANVDAESTQWSRQTQARRNLAAAELDFFRLQFETDAAQPRAAAQTVDLGSRIVDQEFVLAGNSADLQLAAYRVAWLEAGARGRIKGYEIEVRRENLRAEFLERLYAEGMVTARDLKRCREQVASAENQLQLERNRISNLQGFCQAMKASEWLRDSDAELESGYTARLDTRCSWPPYVLLDIERLRYVISLRRHYFDLEGQRAAIHCKLKMRRRCQRKLHDAIVQSSEVSSIPSSSRTDANELCGILVAGAERELVALQFGIDELQARIQDFDENMAILAWEEERFIVQCKHQDQAVERSFVTVSTGNMGGAARGSGNYLESLEFENLVDRIIFEYAHPEYLDFTLDRRERFPLLHANLNSSSLTSSSQRLEYRTDASTVKWPTLGGLTRSPGISIRPSATYHSAEFYPSGNLRADLRNRLPVGSIPWYLPGSPTNLK